MKKKVIVIFSIVLICIIGIYEAVILIANDAVPLAEGNFARLSA